MIRGQQKIRGIRSPVGKNLFVGRIGRTAGHVQPMTAAQAQKALSLTASKIPYDDSAGAATANNVQDAIGNNATAAAAAATLAAAFDLVIIDVEGKPTVGEVLPFFTATRAMTFPASLAGAQGYAKTAATADAAFALNKNGSNVATVTFAAGSHTCTFTSAGFSLAAGDRLEPVGPSPADTTLSDICVTLQGTR